MFEWDFFQTQKYGEGFVCVESHQNMNFTALLFYSSNLMNDSNDSSYNIEQLQCNIIYTMHCETPGNGAYQDICINLKKKQGRIRWKYVF